MTLYRSTSYQHQSSRQLQQHQPTTTSSSIYHHYNNNTTINNSLLSSYSSNQNPLYELPQVSYPVKHIPFTFSIPTQISNHHNHHQQHSINTNISTFAWPKPCNVCNSDSSSSLSPTTRREIKESRVVELEYRNNIISHMLSMEKKTVSDPSMIDTQPEIKWHMRPYLLDFLIKTHLNLGLTNETLFLAVNIIDRYSSQRIVFKRHYKLLGCTALWIASKYNDKKIKVPTLNELKLMCANTYDSHMFTQMELHILTTLEWTIGHPTVDLFVDLCSSDGTSSSNESFPHTVSCHQTKNLVLYLCELSLYHKEFLAFTPSVLASAAFKLASLMVSNYTTYYYYPENYKRNNSNTEPLYLIPTNKMEHSCLEYLIYFSPSPTTCLETKYSTQKTCRAFSIVKMFFQNCLRIKKLIFKPAYLSSSSSSPLANTDNIDNNNIINDSSSSSSSSNSSDSTTPKTSPKQIQHYSKTPSRSSSILSSSRSPSTSPNSTITATNDYETPRKKRKISSSTEKSLYYYLSSDLTSSSSSTATTHGMVTPSYNKPNSITPVTTPMHSHIFSTATTTTSAAKAHPHNHHNHHNNNTQYYHLPKPSEVLSTIKPCSNNNKISSSSNLCRRQTSISTIITTKPTSSSSLGYMTPPFTPDEEEDENKEEENNDREEEEKEEKNINQNDLLVDKKSSIITTKIVNTTNNSNNKSNLILIKDHTKYPTLNNYHYHHQQQQQRPAVRTISLDVENNYK